MLFHFQCLCNINHGITITIENIIHNIIMINKMTADQMVKYDHQKQKYDQQKQNYDDQIFVTSEFDDQM